MSNVADDLQAQMQKRAARARADAIDAFTRSGPVPSAYVCPFCAALVIERERHCLMKFAAAQPVAERIEIDPGGDDD